MRDRVFVDTNVLIYAHDLDAGHKHAIASGILRDLWSTRRGMLSTQVLQEFYVNVTQKIPSPLSRAVARQIVRSYFVWPIEILEPALTLKASDLEERHQLSFWDALIVTAALAGGAARLLTEDLNPGQTLEGILIENPFALDPGISLREGKRRALAPGPSRRRDRQPNRQPYLRRVPPRANLRSRRTKCWPRPPESAKNFQAKTRNREGTALQPAPASP